eukprot:208268_1
MTSSQKKKGQYTESWNHATKSIYTANTKTYHGMVADFRTKKNVKIPIYQHSGKYLLKWRHSYFSTAPKMDQLKKIYLKQYDTCTVDDWQELIKENVFINKSDGSGRVARVISIHLLSILFKLNAYPYKKNVPYNTFLLGNWSKHISGNRGKYNNNSSSSRDGDSDMMPKSAKLEQEEQEVYVPERIDNHRINNRGKKEYYVKWEGYDTDDNTWEPIKHLCDVQ